VDHDAEITRLGTTDLGVKVHSHAAHVATID
jgi:hypothetical protein